MWSRVSFFLPRYTSVTDIYDLLTYLLTRPKGLREINKVISHWKDRNQGNYYFMVK